MAYSKRDWEKLVRKIASDSSHVLFTKHVLQRMKQRKITQAMAFDVLLKGNIHLEPELDIKTGHAVCRMQRFIAGKPLAISAACEDENATECVVVTAFFIGD